ncbi:MAG: SIS domain-containing protein, partial [Candidatus Aenigmatarchaeota archaeon]
DFFAIIIRDKAEDERVRKQIEAAKQVIKNHDEIWVKGNSHLSKLFYAIYFGDYISYYLAEMLGEDPDIVKNIDFIKKNIR